MKYPNRFRFLSEVAILFLLFYSAALAGEKNMKSQIFNGLKFRSLGPALTSGRIIDLAVNPNDRAHYFVAAASGGVWVTHNAGITYQPVFDREGSYSIGCVALDPNNPHVVWVGTGENNSQRSVGYGDGVYKSLDGGKSWKNMGLRNSEHIGKIVIDPRQSEVVYVAAQGPLWKAGGDRGLYKTTDGGKTWKRVLYISENTGISDLVYDPRNPDVLYVAAYQRRRHVWTLINGGPESAIYKSTDGGESWRKITQGLPKVDLGRIGLAISPANPDVIYAIVEAAEGKGGFFRSTDRGESWEKRSAYVSRSPQYYQEIFCDPVDVDRIYSMDVWMQVSEDGGKTFQPLGEKYKHVDNHALWIDPQDPDYLLAGCDGGIYESYDRGKNWHFKANLPVTQFYKIAVDSAFPFYNVYGGTQDNFTLGGPSRTTSANGITNRDWFITLGGDGFQPVVDPEDPNIIYCQYQYGGLARFDRRSGERVYIQPQPGKDEAPLRWNWDSPLIISPHSHTRLYFAANKIFRSDDRGNSWVAISPDLTRQIDRNKLPVMGKIWSIDAVSKNRSTSFYGNIVALSESPLQEGLLYAGTDDGLIQVTEDGGKHWRRIAHFPGVPDTTYVNALLASQHSANTVYAAFNNHKRGDFQPYLLKSTDRGKSWKSVVGNLPQRGSIYTIAEDYRNPNLLFVGTEFGVFFTVDGGQHWTQLKGGLPTIAVRDLRIQKRENDLVVGTFGRGIYILDDYSPLRMLSADLLEREAVLFPVKKTYMYIQSNPLGQKDKSFQGASFFNTPNPFGAVFTYYLKEEIPTRRKVRREKEKALEKAGKPVYYPSWAALKQELREEKPTTVLTVRDETGKVVRRLTGPVTAGFHRITWDLRYPPLTPVELKKHSGDNPFASSPSGPMVVPGTYTVSLAKMVDGKLIPLGEPRSFQTVPLGLATLPAKDKAAVLAFQQQTARLQRAVLGARRVTDEALRRIKYLKKAWENTPDADPQLRSRLHELENRLKDMLVELSGDPVKREYNEPAAPSIIQRVQSIVSGHWASTSAPTETQRQAYRIALEKFASLLPQLQKLIEQDLKQIENQMETLHAPWTPGRVPRWKPE